jgi:hypothetical protein
MIGRDQDCALNMKLDLESKDQLQVKTADPHPVRESITGDLAQCYDLANVRRNSYFLLVKKCGRNKERRVPAAGCARRS